MGGGSFGSMTFGETTTKRRGKKPKTTTFSSGWGGMKPIMGSVFGSTKPKTPTAPASPTPAAPNPAAAPFDAAYEQGVSALNTNRDTALAAIAKQRTNISQLYGLNADGSENTTDPFSRLSQLKADYEKIKRGSLNSYADRGLGYSGAMQNKVMGDYDRNLRANDSLRKDFAAQNDALTEKELGVRSAYNTDLSNLGFRRAEGAAYAVATGEDDMGGSPAAQPTTRKDKVLAALGGSLGPAVRKRLRAEAKKNGWIQ